MREEPARGPWRPSGSSMPPVPPPHTPATPCSHSRNVENLCPSVHKALRAVDGAMSRILARHVGVGCGAHALVCSGGHDDHGARRPRSAHGPRTSAGPGPARSRCFLPSPPCPPSQGLQAFPLQGKAATIPGGVPNPLLAVPDDVRERLYRNMHRLRAVANKLPSPFPPALRACAALAVSLLRQNFFTQGQARILLPLWEGEAGQGGLEPDSTTSPDPGPAASAVKGSGKGNSGPAETAGRPADADQGAPTQDQPGVGRGSGGRPPLPPQQERWRMQGQAPLASCAVSGRERDADLAEAAGQPGPSFVLPIDPRRAPAAGRKGARGPSAVASAPHIPDRVASGTGADPRQTRVNSREPPATMAQAPQSGAGQGAGTPALAAREAGSVPEKRPVGMEGFGAAAMPARRPAAHPAAPQPAGDPTERCPTPPGVARPGEAVLQSVQPHAAQNLLRCVRAGGARLWEGELGVPAWPRRIMGLGVEVQGTRIAQEGGEVRGWGASTRPLLVDPCSSPALQCTPPTPPNNQARQVVASAGPGPHPAQQLHLCRRGPAERPRPPEPPAGPPTLRGGGAGGGGPPALPPGRRAGWQLTFWRDCSNFWPLQLPCPRRQVGCVMPRPLRPRDTPATTPLPPRYGPSCAPASALSLPVLPSCLR